MKNYIFNLLILFMFFANNLAAEEKQKYYKSIKFDKNHQIIGENELKKDSLTNQYFYKLDFNKDKKVVKIQYFQKGLLSDNSYFGENVAKVEIKYDAKIQKWSFFDNLKKRTSDKNGFYLWIFEFEKNNNLISKKYIDKTQKIREETTFGDYNIRNKFDEKGKVVETNYLDEFENVIELEEGFSTVCYKYDDFGNEIEVNYRRIDGKLATNREFNYATVKYKYDEKFDVTEIAHFDETENPTENIAFGYSKVVYQYDNKRNLIEERYFNSQNQPDDDKKGISAYIYKYDKFNRKIEESYFDKLNNLTEMSVFLGDLSYSTVKYEYNEKGEIEKEFYFDKNGKLVKEY